MAREYRIISGDSHMEVAPERWSKFLPPKYRELAPHTVKLPTGGDAMQVGDDPPDPVGLSNAALPFDQRPRPARPAPGRAGSARRSRPG